MVITMSMAAGATSQYGRIKCPEGCGTGPGFRLRVRSALFRRPTINGPDSISRNNQPPAFQINTGGRSFYAVEVATRAELFNTGSHGSERNSSNFYASWTVRLENVTPYNLPADVWDRLKQADNLFYRLHVANDVNWSNHDVTVADSQADTAPSIQIMSGTTGSEKTITFPSGSTFRVVDTPQDGIDYSDPVGNGTVPLIEVRDLMQENISKNFS